MIQSNNVIYMDDLLIYCKYDVFDINMVGSFKCFIRFYKSI